MEMASYTGPQILHRQTSTACSIWANDRCKLKSMLFSYYIAEETYRIRQCIKQLIYRLNLQQFRNAKYRRKSQPCEDSQDGTQETMYASIEISSDEETLRPLVEYVSLQIIFVIEEFVANSVGLGLVMQLHE
jgi:hypothetical protein